MVPNPYTLLSEIPERAKCFSVIDLKDAFYSVGFPAGAEVKVSACNVGDLGSIPGSGRSPEKEMATHSSILAWRIPWTEELAHRNQIHLLSSVMIQRVKGSTDLRSS